MEVITQKDIEQAAQWWYQQLGMRIWMQHGA